MKPLVKLLDIHSANQLVTKDWDGMNNSQNNPVSIPKSRRSFLRNTALGLTATSLADLLRPASNAAAASGTGPGQVEEIRDPNPLIRIGVFDAAFRDLSIERLIELIKEFKIEAVELASGNDVGNPHCDREVLVEDESKRRAYAALFDKNNIMISAFSCHGNPVHPDRDKAQREDRVYRQTIDLAAKMGVNRMVCFSGCPGDGTGKHPNWIAITRFEKHPVTEGLRCIAFQTGGTVDDFYAVARTSEKSWATISSAPGALLEARVTLAA